MGCKVYSDNRKCEVAKGGSMVAVGERKNGLYYMQFKVKQPEKPREFAIIEIESSVLIEANKTTEPNENIESGSIVIDKSNDDMNVQGDDASQSSTYTTASQSSTYTTASADDSSKSEEQASEQQSVLSQQHEQAKGISDRRKSAVCDIMQENIIDSRLRNPQATIEERKENDEKNGDTAFKAVVDETKTKRERHKKKK